MIEIGTMRYLRYLLISVFSLAVIVAEATHIRAGEVVAKRVSGLTYQFTFIGYRDADGVPFGNGTFDLAMEPSSEEKMVTRFRGKISKLLQTEWRSGNLL